MMRVDFDTFLEVFQSLVIFLESGLDYSYTVIGCKIFGIEFDTFLVKFQGFFIFVEFVVDSAKTEVGMLIFGIDFDTFFKPFDSFFILTLQVLHYSDTIKRRIILRIDFYRLLIVLDSLIIIFLGLQGNSDTIICSGIIFIRFCQFDQHLYLLINILFSNSDDIVSIDVTAVPLFCFVCPLPGFFFVVLLEQFDEGDLLVGDVEIGFEFDYLFIQDL